MCKSERSPPRRWQNCYFSPSKSGFKDQHLAGWDGVRCGLHVYQVTHFKDTLPYTASDESKGAKDRATLSLCHYHHCQRMDGSFFSIIIGLFYPPPSINNASEEYDLFLWIFLKGSKHFSMRPKWSLVCQRLIHRWHCWLMLRLCCQHCKKEEEEEEGRIST